MKTLIMISIFTTSLFAQSAFDIFAGYSDGDYNNSKVKSSTWLNSITTKLEREYDFHENVSYVGEEWDKVEAFCDYSEEESKLAYESEMEEETDWNKVTDKNGNTIAYIQYLFASLKYGCLFPRGIYVINKKGVEISANDLYTQFGIDWFYFLENTYLD